VASIPGSCFYCGYHDGPLTVDHLIPRARGGTNASENRVPCCPRCNTLKGDRTDDEFIAWLEETGRDGTLCDLTSAEDGYAKPYVVGGSPKGHTFPVHISTVRRIGQTVGPFGVMVYMALCYASQGRQLAVSSLRDVAAYVPISREKYSRTIQALAMAGILEDYLVNDGAGGVSHAYILLSHVGDG